MDFALAEAVSGELELHCRFVGCELMVHPLRNHESCSESATSSLGTPECGPEGLQVVCGLIESCTFLKKVQVPFLLVFFVLFRCGVDDKVGFGSISNSSSFRVLADESLVAHDPHVYQSSVGVDQVERVASVMFKQV